MVKEVLSIKANPEDGIWFKDLAKGFNTQAEAFNALRQVYEGKTVYQPEVLLNKEVYQSVCYAIGTKLPDAWELKTHKREKKDKIWYVFPDEQVAAIRKKSPNGSQSWLQVAAIYPDEVWEAAKSSPRFEYSPITTLSEEERSYKEEQTKRSHPIVNEALSKGWEFDRWWWKLPEIVNEAKDYLQTVNLLEEVNQPEVLPVDEVYQKCVCDSQEPTTLTKADLPVTHETVDLATDTPTATGTPDTLAGVPSQMTRADLVKRLAKSPKEARTYENQLIHLGGGNMRKPPILKWTAEKDPDGISWLPTDETREYWVQNRAIATAEA